MKEENEGNTVNRRNGHTGDTKEKNASRSNVPFSSEEGEEP